eukprot:7266247-Pyramimonas_sp.AAC.1
MEGAAFPARRSKSSSEGKRGLPSSRTPASASSRTFHSSLFRLAVPRPCPPPATFLLLLFLLLLLRRRIFLLLLHPRRNSEEPVELGESNSDFGASGESQSSAGQ